MAGREYTAEDVERIYSERFGRTRNAKQQKNYTAEDVEKIYNDRFGKTRTTQSISDDTLKLFDTYNTYQNNWMNEMKNLPMNGYAGEQNMQYFYQNMQKTKEDLINKHGVQAGDFDRIASERKYISSIDPKVQAYNERKKTALDGLSNDTVGLLDEYNSYKTLWKNAHLTGTGGMGADVYRNYSAMQNARKKLINEYGVSETDLEKLAQYRKEEKDKETTTAMRENISSKIEENPWGAGAVYTTLDIATSPVHGLMAAAESVNRLGYADKDAPVNTNSVWYLGQNFAQATEEAVNNQIDSNVGRFAYNVGVSTGKAVMAVGSGAGITKAMGLTGAAAKTVGEIVTLPMFGTSSYASTLQADQEKGISTEKAMAHAVVAGMSEMFTELLPLDNLWNIAGNAGRVTAVQTIKNILKQAGMEGAEEGIASIANRIADDVINGNQSAYNQNVWKYMVEEGMTEQEAKKKASMDFFSEVATDVLAGALSGGIMGTGATVAGKLSYNELGVQVNSDAELKNAVVEAAKTMDEGTTAREIADSKDVKGLTDSDVAKILESMDEIEGNEAVNQIREQIYDKVQKNAEMGQKETAETENNTTTQSADTVEGEILANAQQEQVNGVADTSVRGNNTVVTENNRIPVRESGKKKGSTVSHAVISATAEPVIAIKIESISNNNAKVRLDNPGGGSRLVDLSELSFREREKQQLYNFASTMETPNVANAVIEEYSGEPIDIYAQACAVFYNAGKLGSSSFQTLIKNPKNTRLIAGVNNTATLKLMYEMGVNNRSQENVKVAPVQQIIQNKQAGKVTDNRTNRSDNRIKAVAELAAKWTGLEITLNDSLEHGENGHFQQALSRIALSETSQNQFETLVHELNEFAGTYNPEGTKKVINTVLDYAQSKEGVAYLTKRVQQYQDAYKQVETNKTYESAAEEFVFDYLAGVFSQKEGVESLIQFMSKENISETEQKNIIDTIADFFKNIYYKICEYLEEHLMSDTARRGLEADAQQAKEIREMVLEVWEEAIENSKTVKTVESGKKYSFAGGKSITASRSTLEKAEDMYFDGMDSEEIRQETGWHRGYDGAWRYEIDDSQMQLKETDNPETLGQLIEHKELFDAYPQLVNVGVKFVENKKESGSYNTKAVSIELSSGLKQNTDRLKGTLIHEIQHAIQHIEGFTNGANIEYWNERLGRGYDSRTIKAQREYEQLWKKYQNVKAENPEFGAEMEALDKMTPTVPRGEIDWVTFEQIEADPIEWQQYDAERDRLSEKYGEEKVFDFIDLKYKLSEAEAKGVRTAEDLYYATAGEVEARDASGRLSYTESERKQYEPKSRMENIEKDEVVFSSNIGMSYAEEVRGDDVLKSPRDIMKKVYSLHVDDYILQKAQQFKEEGYKKFERIKVLDMTERINEEIKRLIGFDAAEYQIFSNTNTYEHIESRHGEKGTHDQSMKDLRDVALMKYILQTYDSAELVLNSKGEPDITNAFVDKYGNPSKMIKFSKDINGIQYVVIAAPENKYKKIWVISEYKKQKNEDTSQPSHGKNTPPPTPKAKSDNVSSVNSIPQSEENDIKKYSINVDDALFDALSDTYSEQEQGDASIVQQGFESLKNVTVDERMISKIAYAIKKEYQSTYSKEKLTENLTRVFAYLKDTKNVQYEDMVRIMREVAKPVLEESTDINDYEKQMYDDFRNYFKGKTILLNKEQRAEVEHYYGSLDTFRKMNFGKITFAGEGFAKKGIKLDSIWSEICDKSYQMLDYDVSVADQPIVLMDLMNELKPVKRNIYGMNVDEAAYDLALDIFRRFFVEQAQEAANQKVNAKAVRLTERQQEFRRNVNKEYRAKVEQIRESEAKRRERLKAYYEDKLEDVKRSKEAALEHKDKQAAEMYTKQADQYVKLLSKLKRANEKIVYMKAAQRQNTVNRHRNEDIRRYRERVKKNAKSIITYFNTNTDKKHVPEALKDTIAEFITSIDFFSDRADQNSAAQQAWQASLNKLHLQLSSYSSAVEGGYEEVYNALFDRNNGDEKVSSLLNDIQSFLLTNDKVQISRMGYSELQQLDEIMTALKRAITTVNQLYVNKRTSNVEQLGNGTISELGQKKDKKYSVSKVVEMADNLLDINMLDARSFFQTLGGDAMSIYEGLRDGFSERVWLIRDAQEHINKILKGKDIFNWTGEQAKVHTFIVGGKELRMTTGQIMSLYELRKRKQADIHMKVGGVIPTKFISHSKSKQIGEKEYGFGKKTVEQRVKGIRLSEYDMDRICNVLTVEQKKVADDIQHFLGSACAEWGNKTTMKMYGYRRFDAKNYFPIKTDGASVDTKDDTKFFGTKNSGFTKSTMPNANNAIIVDDIFDVFTNHVTEMATYSTFTAPLMDAMKWYNYKQKKFEDKRLIQHNSVKLEIKRVYGNEYLKYFEKLIKDINAESKKGIESQISDHMVSRMKAASVGANLRVAIQQPTAYIRASAVMNPKYLAKAVFTKAGVEKAKKYSAIAQWKDWGYFDTAIGRSMRNVITGQDTFRNKLVEKSMWMAQKGDEFTWGYLWNACEAEIKDKYPELQYNSEEFIEAVVKRFDEVVDQTQVVDTVLHRSQIMRSDNGATQMATAFMSEPTKSYNMLRNALRGIENGKNKKEIKNFGRVALAYMTTQTINAVATAIMDAVRDLEDDDDTFLDNWMQAFGENVVDNMNPLGMIPYAKDIISIMEGYSVSRLDMQGISKLINSARSICKYMTDEKYRSSHGWFDLMKNFINGLSQVFGIPAYNLLRDTEGLYHTVTGEYLGGVKITSKYSKFYAAVKKAKKSGEVSDRTAIKTEIDALLSSGVEKKTIVGRITSTYKEEYLEAKLNGKYADFKNLLISMYMMVGVSREDAIKKIDSWK